MLVNSVKFFFLLSLLLLFGSPVLGQTNSGGGIGVGDLPAGTARPRILSKPEPELPKNANVQGDSEFVIVLRAIFASDGKVKNIYFVKVTPKDAPKEKVKIFKQRAIEAAKMIQFIPATRNGRPVSMLFQLEYSFSPPTEDLPVATPPDTDSSKAEVKKPKI
jgi:hypothetical protein